MLGGPMNAATIVSRVSSLHAILQRYVGSIAAFVYAREAPICAYLEISRTYTCDCDISVCYASRNLLLHTCRFRTLQPSWWHWRLFPTLVVASLWLAYL